MATTHSAPLFDLGDEGVAHRDLWYAPRELQDVASYPVGRFWYEANAADCLFEPWGHGCADTQRWSNVTDLGAADSQSRSIVSTSQSRPATALDLVLDELDCELERRGHCFVRYADDCNVYVRSEKAGHRVMASLTRFIEGRLKLQVNAQPAEYPHRLGKALPSPVAFL